MRAAQKALAPDALALDAMEKKSARLEDESKSAQSEINAITKQAEALWNKYSSAQEKFDGMYADKVRVECAST
jgi:peptidoglycan hydrolase CwlO-like protein